MANKKITELTEATSITGTDVLAIVNGGITKKVNVDTLASFVNTEFANNKFLPLSGGTMTGTLTAWYSSTQAGLNIGPNTVPTNPVNGDIWLEGNAINYRENSSGTPTTRAVAKANGVNLFSSYQSIQANDTNNPALSALQTGNGGGISILNQGNGTGLKITSTGTGFALRIEDEPSVDTTSFIVDNSGNVGIGLTSANAISANKLTVVGNISATQDYFSGNNKSVFTPQTNTIGVSAVSSIVAVSVLPVSPDPSTLYIIV